MSGGGAGEAGEPLAHPLLTRVPCLGAGDPRRRLPHRPAVMLAARVTRVGPSRRDDRSPPKAGRR